MFTRSLFTILCCCTLISTATRLLKLYDHTYQDDLDLEIHVFAWKRSRSLSRLLRSLESAVRPPNMTVSITFHVDFGHEPKVTKVIDSFDWTFGPKRVQYNKHRYGLPHNILHSWNPTNDHQYALFLEDDVEVSPYYLFWAQHCILGLKSNADMIGCSLYTPIVDEIGPAPNAWSPPKWSPWRELGSDRCFHFQLPCSWGAIYSSRHWLPFIQYYSLRFWMESAPDAPNSRTIEWFKSWKRHLIELMLENGWYLLYPFSGRNHTSFSTNYFEKGVHSVPINQEPVYYDSLKSFDHRFTVPLIKDEAQAFDLIENCKRLSNPKTYNLYHKRVQSVADLNYSMQALWRQGHLKELKHYSNARSRTLGGANGCHHDLLLD